MGEPSTTPPRWASLGVTAQAAPRGLPGPVVVGGVGGSGTRVLAQMMVEMGIYIGTYLNAALDNTWFGRLFFGQERWLEKASPKELTRALRVFDRAMHNELSPVNIGDALYVTNAVLRKRLLEPSSGKKRIWLRDIVRDRITSIASMLQLTLRTDLSRYRAWGWKAPRSHIMLSALADYYPTMKYVLLVRHGLDMTLSKNQRQAGDWSSFYDLPQPSYPITPAASLSYWVTATEAAISVGQSRLGSRFMVLHYEDLCMSPETGVDKFIDLIGLDVSDETRAKLIKIPYPPTSIGRYKQLDLSQFNPADIEAVRRLGFEVNP